jgi:hypothetical protein
MDPERFRNRRELIVKEQRQAGNMVEMGVSQNYVLNQFPFFVIKRHRKASGIDSDRII